MAHEGTAWYSMVHYGVTCYTVILFGTSWFTMAYLFGSSATLSNVVYNGNIWYTVVVVAAWPVMVVAGLSVRLRPPPPHRHWGGGVMWRAAVWCWGALVG